MAIDFDRMASAGRTIVQRAPMVPRGVFIALGVGVAFGAGIVFGGSGGAHATGVREERDQLVLAADKSAALEETRTRLKLSYANELQKPDPAEPHRAPPPRAAAAKQEEAAAPLEPPPAPLVEAPVVALAPAAAKPAAAAAEIEGESERDEDVEKRSGADLKAALARVVDDARPGARFSLQVAAAPTQAGAEEVARKLGAQGHAARVVEGQVGGKPVFRVRVGAFNERAQADGYKSRLAMPAFIVTE